MQLQHRSTCRRACPPELPVEVVPKPPVGVLPLLSPSPMAGHPSWMAKVHWTFLPLVCAATLVALELPLPLLRQLSLLPTFSYLLPPFSLPPTTHPPPRLAPAHYSPASSVLRRGSTPLCRTQDQHTVGGYHRPSSPDSTPPSRRVYQWIRGASPLSLRGAPLGTYTVKRGKIPSENGNQPNGRGSYPSNQPDRR